MKKAFCAALLALSPCVASAGILADMNSMFLSNTTAPSTMSTADRVGVFGGSFTMRAPIQNVHLLTFDPPRIDAGCGGIDLYAGSFSFINGAELIQVFREVAADAEGLAFKAAIKAISPSLDALITEFQTLMQNLNNLSKNSCQMAHMLIDPAANALSNAVNGDGSVASTNSGLFGDAFSGLTNYLSDANSYLSNVSKNTPTSGNNLAKMVTGSGAASIMGDAGLGNVDGSSDDASNPNSLNNKLIYALLGYHVDAVPCNSLNQDGTGVTTSTPANNTVGIVSCNGPALIQLNDLIEGGGTGSVHPDNPLGLYECVNPSGSVSGGVDSQICTQMQKQDFSYQGIKGWVNNMLFGSVDPSDSITSTSIVGEINSTSSTQFTPAQIQFLNQAGIPLTALLTKTSNPNTRISIASRLEPHIVDCVAAQIGQTLYKGTMLIQNSTGYTLSDDQKSHITQLRSDFLAKQQLCDQSEVVGKIVKEINEDAKFTSSSIR